MKILVTGGAGFIGSHIVDAYVADGHDVVIVDNLSTGKRENINPKAKFYEMDICDSNVARIFQDERPEILNHHAAQIDVRISVADPRRDMDVNLGGLINLLEAGHKNGLKKVVFASSGGAVYGDDGPIPTSETHVAQPISPYGLNKLASEKYLFFYEKAYGLEWVALRYSNVYGPRQNCMGEAGVVAIFINKMLCGKQPVINGDGTQTRDYVYVGDVVEANRLAIVKGMSGIYNIGTGVETDVRTIFGALKEFTAAKSGENYGPAKKGEQQRSCISPGKIEAELGWRPRTELHEGIKNTVEWFKDRGSSPN